MYQFIKYSETLSTDGLASQKKYDYQIKCQPGCCIFNSQSCLLIPPLYLPDLSPHSFPKNWNKPTFRIFCDLSLPYFSSNHIPHISSFSCCLWSELDSQPTAISPLHWRSLNEGRHISLEDWVSVSPRLLLSLTHCLNTEKASRWSHWEVQNHTNPSTDEMTDWRGRRAKFLQTTNQSQCNTQSNTQILDIR